MVDTIYVVSDTGEYLQWSFSVCSVFNFMLDAFPFSSWRSPKPSSRVPFSCGATAELEIGWHARRRRRPSWVGL